MVIIPVMKNAMDAKKQSIVTDKFSGAFWYNSVKITLTKRYVDSHYDTVEILVAEMIEETNNICLDYSAVTGNDIIDAAINGVHSGYEKCYGCKKVEHCNR